ncbi:MAG: hypothetical protein M1825_001116 [Sarcosagium campestre]|nr:MAG: hypothetical protein M1825_001116 [Sarcosagium campestre]
MASFPPSIASRTKGGIYGVAIADALGGPVEFKRRGSFPPVQGFRHNAHFDLPPGSWTDDTSMTLCLAQSLIDHQGAFMPFTAVSHYIKWWKDGHFSSTGQCFDIGNATLSALGIWKDFLHVNPSYRLAFVSGTAVKRGHALIERALDKPSKCGNGALMRVAPIGLMFYDASLEVATYVASLSAQATHPHDINLEACAVYTILVHMAMRGKSKDAMASYFGQLPWLNAEMEKRFATYTSLEAWEAKASEEISSSGYVIHTLEAALWAFFTTNTFRDGALLAVNLGDDADTVGAIYGGLAGSFYGLEEIPSEWKQGLQRLDLIDKIASRLAEMNSEKVKIVDEVYSTIGI